MPSPPFPDPLSPLLQLVVDDTLKALQAGDITPEQAVLHAAVHGWYEGHIEGEDACGGCDYRGGDPTSAEQLRRYRG
jgi:hypothetical protein